MSSVLTRDWGRHITSRRRAIKGSRFFVAAKAEKKMPGNIQISLASMASLLAAIIIFSCAFYLYQVNNIATKGYEMREFENNIQKLEKESQKLKIKEVELKSMYNIEKSTQDMNLVRSAEVSYVEIDGPVAMK